MKGDEQTSLDRFVCGRGAAIILRAPSCIGWWRIVAVANLMIGLLFLALPVVTHNLWQLLLPIPFFGSGIGMAALAAHLRRSLSGGVAPAVHLTPEAGRLLDELSWHTESGWGRRTPSCREALAPGTFEILEEAARHYNRAHAAVAIGSGTASPPLARLGPDIRAVADEAMAELLHAAALMEKYPEN